MGRGLIESRGNTSTVTWDTKLIAKMSREKSLRRTAYPCGCRACREMAGATRRSAHSSLAAIDVYDMPDRTVPDYFH
jgi:hypothetical protein